MSHIFYCKEEHYLVFQDYLDSIFNNLKNCQLIMFKNNYDILTKYKYNPNQKHIFMLTIPHTIAYQKNMYLCNTEQLTRPKWKRYICALLNRGIKIIDYSEENMYLLEDCVNDISRFNIYHLPYQVNYNEVYNFKKTKDVCIMGLKGSRRTRIYNALKRSGVNIDYISGWKKARDLRLFRYKIILNIHYNETYNVTEQMRINRCIFNKMLVISEPSDFKEKLLLRPYIIFRDYDNIVKTVHDVLDKYNHYYNMMYSNFDLKVIDNKLKNKLEEFT